MALKKPFNEVVEGPESQHDNCRASLLDGVIFQVLITFRILGKFRLVVDALRHFETADAIRNIGLDVGYGFDLFQITSDRGGTTVSGHVGYRQRHQHHFGTILSRCRRRRILHRGCSAAAETPQTGY